MKNWLWRLFAEVGSLEVDKFIVGAWVIVVIGRISLLLVIGCILVVVVVVGESFVV